VHTLKIYGQRTEKQIMDDKTVSKPSAPFVLKDLYKQAEDFGLCKKVPRQTKLALDKQGLVLCLSTGTQDEKQVKKKKSCFVRLKAQKAKHTNGSIMQKHMHDFKQQLVVEEETEDDNSKQAVMKENDNPNTTTPKKNDKPKFHTTFCC
jgi:hypothetical protein